jgi:predicted nucleic acid-binding Zn ribbon protein
MEPASSAERRLVYSKTGLNLEIQVSGPMPLRDYQCPNCEFKLVDQLSYTVTPYVPLCQHCGSEMVVVVSNFEPRFVGPGFYETDYKKKEPPTDVE